MGGVGESIKLARNKANMTQDDLGKKIGVSRDTIRRWEHGRSDPSVKEVAAIAEVTGYSFDEGPGISLDTRKKMVVAVVSMRMPACAGAGNGGICLEDAESKTEVDMELFSAIDDIHRPFGVFVDGDSMEEIGICDGDVAFVNPAEMPEDGEVALVCYKDRLSIKGIRRNKDGSVSLMAGKPEYNMIVPADEADDENWFRVIGKVVLSRREQKPKRFW